MSVENQPPPERSAPPRLPADWAGRIIALLYVYGALAQLAHFLFWSPTAAARLRWPQAPDFPVLMRQTPALAPFLPLWLFSAACVCLAIADRSRLQSFLVRLGIVGGIAVQFYLAWLELAANISVRVHFADLDENALPRILATAALVLPLAVTAWLLAMAVVAAPLLILQGADFSLDYFDSERRGAARVRWGCGLLLMGMILLAPALATGGHDALGLVCALVALPILLLLVVPTAFAPVFLLGCHLACCLILFRGSLLGGRWKLSRMLEVMAWLAAFFAALGTAVRFAFRS